VKFLVIWKLELSLSPHVAAAVAHARLGRDRRHPRRPSPRGAWVGTPEGGDAVGGGSSRGVGAAADDGGDFGVGQSGQVVVGDGLFLLGGQLGECLGQFGGGVRLGVAGGGRRGIRCLGDGDRAAGGRAGDVDGLAVGDGHEPRFDVGVGRKIGIGLHRGQEGF
jgi:hypothetical protein